MRLRTEQSGESKNGKTGPYDKRPHWTHGIPQGARDDACGQHGKTTEQIEHAVSGATQFCWRGIGHQHGEQALGEAHMQAPKGHTNRDKDEVCGEAESYVRGCEQRETDHEYSY